MKRRRVKIRQRGQGKLLDLPQDLVKDIAIRVGGSSNGAKDLARAFSTCKAFRHFVEDGDVLRAVAFDDLLEFHGLELFQLKEGLVTRCAQAGHLEAQFLLFRILVVSTSNLVTTMKTVDQSCSPHSSDNDVQEKLHRLSSFVKNFLPDQVQSPEVLRKLSHFDLVKLFLSRADSSDLVKRKSHLKKYLHYFLEKESFQCECLILSLDGLRLSFRKFEFIYKSVYLLLGALFRHHKLDMIVEAIETAHLSSTDPVKRSIAMAKCLSEATVPSGHTYPAKNISCFALYIQNTLHTLDETRESVISVFDLVSRGLPDNDAYPRFSELWKVAFDPLFA